jgi:uncharacterized protein YqfB (UPF0267 family)
MLKDSLQRGERVELATNKVTFWGTQNDTVRSNQETILRHYSLKHLPANAHKISYKNENYRILKEIEVLVAM